MSLADDIENVNYALRPNVAIEDLRTAQRAMERIERIEAAVTALKAENNGLRGVAGDFERMLHEAQALIPAAVTGPVEREAARIALNELPAHVFLHASEGKPFAEEAIVDAVLGASRLSGPVEITDAHGDVVWTGDLRDVLEMALSTGDVEK